MQMCTAAAAAAPVHDHHHQIVKSEKRKKSLRVDSLSFSLFLVHCSEPESRADKSSNRITNGAAEAAAANHESY